MSIIKTLYLSTRHMDKNDNSLIERGSANLCSEDTEFGWIIHVNPVHVQFYKDFNALKEEGFTKQFLHLMVYAHENGCEWIRFDSEGPVDNDFPTFNW